MKHFNLTLRLQYSGQASDDLTPAEVVLLVQGAIEQCRQEGMLSDDGFEDILTPDDDLACDWVEVRVQP